jgi:hypothetical protein
MRTSRKALWIIVAVIATFNFMSCEDDIAYVEKEPAIIEGDLNLTYTDIITFPYMQELKTDTPQFNIPTDLFQFRIFDVVQADTSIAINKSLFTIDEKSGVITIDNSKGNLTQLYYKVDVGVGSVDGMIRVDSVFKIELLEIPLGHTITQTAVSAGALEAGDMATVAFVDNSGEGVIDNVSYALSNEPTGFSIDETTGIISKSTSAASGENRISVQISTNMGAKTFEDILTVTVGNAPTIEFALASDGTTKLATVTLSPWSTYTSAIPTLTGMNDGGGYEIIVPDTIPAGAVVANANGTITVTGNAVLSGGEFPVGVTVTNSTGASKTFEDLFSIVVEQRWEAFFADSFDDGLTDVLSTLYPSYANYTLSGTDEWAKAVVAKAGLPTIEGIRRFNPKSDACLVKTIDIGTDIKGLRITFGEQFGYNDTFIPKYNRMLYVGEDVAELANTNFVDADWTEVMSTSDSRWSTAKTWASRLPNNVPDIDIDLSGIIGSTVYLNWRFNPVDVAVVQNGQYAIDYINASASKAYAAEEAGE